MDAENQPNSLEKSSENETQSPDDTGYLATKSSQLAEQEDSSSCLFKRLPSYCYYLSAYTAICYYALRITQNYGGNDLQIVVESDDFSKLTASAVGFLSTDMVYKYYQQWHQPRQRSGSQTTLYYALQLHHVIGITGYLVAWSAQKGHLLVSNLSLFELSSIPLLFYSDRILVPISLPATWISYLVVRIIWGNIILLDGLRQITTQDVGFSQPAVIFLDLMHLFFLIANNYWFYLLTRQLKRKSVTWCQQIRSIYDKSKNKLMHLIASVNNAFSF